MRAEICPAHPWTGAAEADLACWKLGGSGRTFYIATSTVSARVEVPVPVIVPLTRYRRGLDSALFIACHQAKLLLQIARPFRKAAG